MSPGPLAWAATDLQPDDSTAGPSTPSIGPRRGVGFLAAPEPSPDAHLQPSPLTYMTGGTSRVYDGSVQQ